MNSRLTTFMALALLVAAFLSGCGVSPASPASPDEATASPPQSETGEPETTAPRVDPDSEARTTTPTCAPLAEEETMSPEGTPQATESALSAGAAEVVQLAKDDLARKVNVAPEAIMVVSIDAVNWPDTSLGCPQPGMMYAQVITPGFKVVLEAEGRTYDYHTDQGHLVVLCDQEGHRVPYLPTPARREIVRPPYSGNVQKLIDIAKRDLARRLAIAPEEIDLVSIETAEWPDTRLGCGEPGLTRLPVAIPGYRVVLSAEGHNHVYHTDRDSGVVYCPKG